MSAAERTTQLLATADTAVDTKVKITQTQEAPKKKRGSSNKCGLCGETGHNKRTCTTFIDLNALD